MLGRVRAAAVRAMSSVKLRETPRGSHFFRAVPPMSVAAVSAPAGAVALAPAVAVGVAIAVTWYGCSRSRGIRGCIQGGTANIMFC